MKNIISRLTSSDIRINFLLLLSMFAGLLLISPKWNIPLASFFLVAVTMRYFRNTKMWKAILFTFLIYVSATFIGNQGVMPFQSPVMLPIIVFLVILNLIPFIIDKMFYKRLPAILVIFLFPFTSLIIDYFIANGPNGTFGHIAYNLVDIKPLMQLTSITGIWGISFIIYLFATVINHLLENYQNHKTVKAYSIAFGILILTVLIFGITRLELGRNHVKDADKIKLAAVTSENKVWSETIHKIVTGKSLNLPKKIDQTSPQLTEFQKSFQEFIRDHENPIFDPVYAALEDYYDEIFENCLAVVGDGAKAILLSEGEMICFSDGENKIIERAREFARQNNIYFFFAMGTIYPEKMKNSEPFIGNKIITIHPDGNIIDTYYKNVPVENVDPSIPGDGIINAIETPFGNFSPVICYDADFPKMMRQTGQNNTDIIMVATGDWYSISPYHSKIGIVRSIENGVSMFKTVSYGLSVAADAYGNIISEDDFFEDEHHIMVSEIPVYRTSTLYSSAGDFLIHISYFYILSIMIYLVLARFRKKHKPNFAFNTSLPFI
jgi:apolipoprotein N-acyltransferase